MQQAPSPKYLAVLAVAACLILGLGWLIRPREVQNTPAPLPTENELAQLARRTERRALDGMTQYFAGTANEADASLVHLPEVGASGVAWNDRTIVTAPIHRRDAGTIRVQWPFGEARQNLTTWGPGVPLAAVAARGLSGLGRIRLAASLPEPGGWIVAVWRAGQDRRFVPGSFVQSAPVSCGGTPVEEIVSSLALHRTMSGGGLFDPDGGLLAVILPCGERFAAVTAQSVDAILKKAATDSQLTVARFGIVFGTMTAEQRASLRIDRGVLVQTVWAGHRGDEAGLRAGDVVFDLNETPVASAPDLTALLARLVEQEVTLRVRRGPQTLMVALGGADRTRAASDQAGAGVVWASPTAGYRVDAVGSGSRAGKAGLESGDRVLRLNYREPQSLAQVQRLLADESGPPVLLEIARDDRRLALFW